MDSNLLYGELHDEDFKRLSLYVYKNYGINLYPNKRVLVKSRLQKRLQTLKLTSYKEYCDYVFKTDEGKKEIVEMINRLSTNKTDFFREPDQFEYLKNTILPGFNKRKFMQLWSTGCSSGEEPYTIAMVIDDFSKNATNINYQIYASDISTSVLAKAQKGIYSSLSLLQIPKQYHKNYLLKSKDPNKKLIRIAPELRNKINFFRYNLLNEKVPLSSRMDIIFCRNTLIYFDRITQYEVVNRLLNNLVTGGYLILGHSESLVNMDLPLTAVSASIYQKNN